MSIPAGVLADEISTQMNKPSGTSDEIWKKQVWQKLQEAYRDVVDAWDWACLKSTVTLSTSFLVPADCKNISRVSDADKTVYNIVNGKNRGSPFNYNWFLSDPINSPLAEGTTLNISEYATALTSTAEFPATTCIGEYCKIGSNPGFYKIETWTSASAMTLTDHFRGDAESAAIFQIRPRGTQVLAFSDSQGTTITPTGIELTYSRFPLPPYRESDIIELPGSCRAVGIQALRKILALSGYNQAADRKNNEYISALTEMKASEPIPDLNQPNTMFQYRSRANNSHNYIRGLSLMNS
jgi:hypothetical protein